MKNLKNCLENEGLNEVAKLNSDEISNNQADIINNYCIDISNAIDEEYQEKK